MLLLLKVAFAIASAEANNGTCCYHKIFPDGSYTLKESNSAEAAAYGCDTANSCVYVKDGTNDRYCMKMGGMTVPDCELRPCEEYLVALNMYGGDILPADGFATDCKPPTFGFPSEARGQAMAKVDGDILVLNVVNKTHHMTKIQANGPAVDLKATFPKTFPAAGPLVTNWGPNKLLAVGGYDDKSADIDLVFKYENGAWTDIGWTLDAVQYGGLGCTYNDKLVMVGGSITDLRNKDKSTEIEKMVIRDLGNSGTVLKTVAFRGRLKTCACQNDKVYVVIKGTMREDKDTLYTYDLTQGGDKLSPLKFPDVADGILGFFRDKLTLFGGYVEDKTGNSMFPIQVKTMQVYDDSKDLWEEKPFELKQIQQSFTYFEVVEK